MPEPSSPEQLAVGTTPASLASTGTTTLIVVLALLALAAAMVALAVWLVRATRRDAPALGPLEVMGDRSWRRADQSSRLTALAAARPTGALAPAPMIDYEPAEEGASAEESLPAEEEEEEPSSADAEVAESATDENEPGLDEQIGATEERQYAQDDG